MTNNNNTTTTTAAAATALTAALAGRGSYALAGEFARDVHPDVDWVAVASATAAALRAAVDAHEAARAADPEYLPSASEGEALKGLIAAAAAAWGAAYGASATWRRADGQPDADVGHPDGWYRWRGSSLAWGEDGFRDA